MFCIISSSFFVGSLKGVPISLYSAEVCFLYVMLYCLIKFSRPNPAAVTPMLPTVLIGDA